MTWWYLAPLMLLSGVLTDLVWAIYIQALADRRRLKAALASVGTGVISVVFVEGVIHDVRVTAFWIGGLFVGTYWSGLFERKIKEIWNVARNSDKDKKA